MSGNQSAGYKVHIVESGGYYVVKTLPDGTYCSTRIFHSSEPKEKVLSEVLALGVTKEEFILALRRYVHDTVPGYNPFSV